jgi:Ca2+/H+ antiporter
VIIGWCIAEPMTLFFDSFQTVAMFLAILVVNQETVDDNPDCRVCVSCTRCRNDSNPLGAIASNWICTELLLESVEDMALTLGVSEVFIAIVFIPIASNSTEHGNSLK